MDDQTKPQDAAPAPAPEPKPEHKEEPKPAAAATEPKKDAPHAKSEEELRILAALSYVGVLFVVPMLVAKDSEFAKYHVRQGIVLFAIEVILSFGFLHPVVAGPVGLLIAIVDIYCIVRTLQGAKWELPLVGKYAQKIKL